MVSYYHAWSDVLWISAHLTVQKKNRHYNLDLFCTLGILIYVIDLSLSMRPAIGSVLSTYTVVIYPKHIDLWYVAIIDYNNVKDSLSQM